MNQFQTQLCNCLPGYRRQSVLIWELKINNPNENEEEEKNFRNLEEVKPSTEQPRVGGYKGTCTQTQPRTPKTWMGGLGGRGV